MRKGMKYLVVIGAGCIALLLGVFLLSFLNHRIKLSQEEEQFQPIGELVEVNGSNLHVYTEGTGEETLVFLSGGGTSSPVLDFKTLYSQLSNAYTVIVVEKAGYGFSEVTDAPRDIDTILAETREALRQSGMEDPYILVPHSMSGIEALYWAQNYPEEVKAIVGLDMAVPSVYEDYLIPMPLIYLGGFVSKLGLNRWIPALSESDAIKNGSLTEQEKELYKVIQFRRTSTRNMINEVKEIKVNAKQVEAGGIPTTPMLLFVSNGEGTGLDKADWIRFKRDFAKRQGNNKPLELDSSHYIHHTNTEKVARDTKAFIKSLQMDEELY